MKTIYEHLCYVTEEYYEKDYFKAMTSAILQKPFHEVTREERSRTKKAFFTAVPHWKKIQKDYVQEALDKQQLELLAEELEYESRSRRSWRNLTKKEKLELAFVVLSSETDWVGWPSNVDEVYNACNQPCDALVGPCACGAWHSLKDIQR